VSDGKGYYHAFIDVTPGYTLRSFLASRDLDPSKGVVRAMARCGVKSMRAFYDVAQLESHPGLFEPIACVAIGQQIAAQEKILPRGGGKHRLTQQQREKRKTVLAEIATLQGQWKSSGCVDTDVGPGTKPA
jgi:hypothetical protein